MYKYETHLHTAPVSRCAHASVEETLTAYKERGYDGVFITNHFLDGNINIDKSLPYQEKLEFYLSDYYNALKIGKSIGINVFFGIETTYSDGICSGTDFLIYGLSPDWYKDHPEIMDMPRTDQLTFFAENGAFIVQAHPFRDRPYSPYLRLFPKHIHAVETQNSCNSDFENSLAENFADAYKLIKTAGSDNHSAGAQENLAAMVSDTPIESEADFIEQLKSGKLRIFKSEQTK